MKTRCTVVVREPNGRKRKIVKGSMRAVTKAAKKRNAVVLSAFCSRK